MKQSALSKSYFQTRTHAKPVLKWAGGKTQLLPILSEKIPTHIGKRIRKYCEPFFGGGAVFFELYNLSLIDEAVIMDANPELILLYQTIKERPAQVIEILETIQKSYLLLTPTEREHAFYEVRTSFNQNKKVNYNEADPVRAAQIIFMNRTCFNGLFRVNKKQEFNVPHGNYKNPRILDIDNIYAVSEALQIAEIIHGDFEKIIPIVQKDTFVYYDPPYRPLNKTSNFNAYAGVFDDSHQTRLAELFKSIHRKDIHQMLSNSDPLSASGDDFFDKLYQEFNIYRVEANRMINSVSTKRGKILELLITNYDAH